MEAIKSLKGERKIVMLTCYDFQSAKLLEEAGIDLILVGDSLGMVVLGYQDTKSVTMEEVLHHTKAVAKGTKLPIIGDMPIHSYDSPEQALENARKKA
jgi:3-methyl-2-oxobutanoate hydroxymethyltransferase